MDSRLIRITDSFGNIDFVRIGTDSKGLPEYRLQSTGRLMSLMEDGRLQGADLKIYRPSEPIL